VPDTATQPTTLPQQQRLLGAALAAPRRFLPVVLEHVPMGVLHPHIRAILQAVQASDVEFCSWVVEQRLGEDQLDRLTFGFDPTVTGVSWLQQIELRGSVEDEASIEAAAREVAERGRDQQIREVLRAAADDKRPVDEVVAEVRERIASADLAAPNRYRTASVTEADLETLELQPPASILGTGVLTTAEYAVLYGQPGLGKSFLTLQLAEAVARGEPFFGVSTLAGRVGVISLEVPAYYVRERLRKIRGIRPATNDVVLYTSDRLRGLTDLVAPREQAEIIAVVRGEGLQALVIDPLALAHRGRETQEDLSAVVAFLKELPMRTGCAPLLVHHEPKEQAEKDRSDLDALRGATILRDMAGTLIRLKQKQGRLVMVWPKVRHAVAPPETWLARDQDSGVLYEIEPPEDLIAKGKENREKVRSTVTPGVWYGAEELMRETGLARTTLWRHLKALGAITRGSTSAAEWCIPDDPGRGARSGLVSGDEF
jgi:hypothetical protein